MRAELPPGWSSRRIDQLGFVGRGRSRHRPRNDPSLYGGPYPFFQTGDVRAAELYLSRHSQTYNQKGLAQSKLWQPGTLCITIAANIAESAILAVEGCFPDSIVGFIADPEEADVRFVKYAIDTMKLQMQSISRGTTQDNLSLDKLLTFGIPVPSLPTQRKIAAILSAYDDLIENNAHRIGILEEMAQLLYREWFVHFRFPGHEDVAMVDSELGAIPEGWKVKQLGDVIELAYGKGLRKKDRIAGPYPVYGSSGIIDSHNEPIVEGPGVIVGRKGNVGSVYWSDKGFCPIDTVFYVKTDVNLRYVYYNLQYQNFIGTHTAVPGLNRNQTYLLPFLLPDKRILQEFERIVEILFAQKGNLESKNEVLRRIRDLLLPRLVSGKLDVADLPIDVAQIALDES